MMSSLSNKVAIITGASSGLGLTTAILFARHGAKVVLGGRDQDRLKASLEQCVEASGGHEDRFITVKGDITDAKVREVTVTRTVEAFGQVDVLVPNAGVMPLTSTLEDADEQSFDLIFNTNVKAGFFLVQQAVPHLAKSKGCVVSVSSIASSLPSTPFILYHMTKSTIDHMTRCLALHLGSRGIRVNTVNPSVLATSFFKDFPVSTEQILEQEKAVQPMGECHTPEDVAQVILFLASDHAKSITGQCVPVDGGRSFTGPMPSYDYKNL